MGAVAPKTKKDFIAVAVSGKGSIQMLASLHFNATLSPGHHLPTGFSLRYFRP
jgi:hypothetical protein